MFSGPVNHLACSEAFAADLNAMLELSATGGTTSLNTTTLGDIAAIWQPADGACEPGLDLSPYGLQRRTRRADGDVFPLYDATSLLIVITNSNGQQVSTQAELRYLLSLQQTAIEDGTIDNYLESSNMSAPGVTRTDLPDLGSFDPVVLSAAQRGPNIISFVASDADNRDSAYSNGDLLTLGFDFDTNQLAVDTKAKVDALLRFEQDQTVVTLGTDYTGVWVDSKTLEIRVVDTTGNTPTPRIGALKVGLRSGSGFTIAGFAESVFSTELSAPLTGSFGEPYKLPVIYWLLPLLLLLVAVTAFVLYAVKRNANTAVITSTKDLDLFNSSAESAWVRPPNAKAMKSQDPFSQVETAVKFSPRAPANVLLQPKAKDPPTTDRSTCPRDV